MPFPLRVNSSWLRSLPVLTKCINFCSVCRLLTMLRTESSFHSETEASFFLLGPPACRMERDEGVNEREEEEEKEEGRLSCFTSGRMALKIHHAPALFSGHEKRIYPDLNLPKAVR